MRPPQLPHAWHSVTPSGVQSAVCSDCRVTGGAASRALVPNASPAGGSAFIWHIRCTLVASMRAVQDVTVTMPFLARRGDSASTSARAELAPVLVRTLGLAPRAMTAIEAGVVMTVLPLEATIGGSVRAVTGALSWRSEHRSERRVVAREKGPAGHFRRPAAKASSSPRRTSSAPPEAVRYPRLKE